jgi:SPP1 gp7 family putative phage head morphogenesis protein
VRTNATDAYNQGRLVAAADHDLAPFMRGMLYSAVIDVRTTPICRHLDGKIFRMDEPELSRLSPPNHFNCRSVLVPVPIGVTVDEDDFITPAEIGRAKELSQEGFK